VTTAERNDQIRRLGARAALHVFRADTGIPPDDPSELLGQLLAGLREESREATGSDAQWGEAVAIMRRVLGEVW
jgi:hypothetical protein